MKRFNSRVKAKSWVPTPEDYRLLEELHAVIEPKLGLPLNHSDLIRLGLRALAARELGQGQLTAEPA